MVCGYAAIVGPAVFAAISVIVGAIQPGYSPQREDISALAAMNAPRAWIMMVAFAILGMSLVAVAGGLRSTLRTAEAGAGAVALAAAGVGAGAAGAMRNDCSSEVRACAVRVKAGEVSWHHHGHDLVSVAVFVLLIVSGPLLAQAFRQAEGWRSLRIYTLATSGVGLLLLVAFGGNVIPGWQGLVERGLVATPLVWVAVIGWRLRSARAGGGPEHSLGAGAGDTFIT